ncbi:recombinase family protein [Yinghuangia sp. YIM S09857]|uniref:recombinase family protein n=1 Tax=Yinghuangia sp. YIM S09857 TaxID=3436929 RepID=UPI003F53B911
MEPFSSLATANVPLTCSVEGGTSLIPVGAYARVSEDKAMKAGAADWREVGEQVAGQFADMDVEAARLGWTITHRYNDNNTPASDPLIVRKDFERMLEDLAAGTIRGILFVHSDRLVRLEYDAARINRLYLINPKLVGRSCVGGTDLSTVEGRAMLSIQATVGGVEVANTKRRVSTTNKKRAAKGHMRGAPRPFGWADDRKSLHPEEAKVLREAILAVPGGKSIGQIRQEWIELGYTPKANKRSGDTPRKLSHSTVEARLVNPRVCGYVTYLPQVDRRGAAKPWLPDHVVYKDSKPARGDWEAIVSPEEWEACVGELEARKQARKEGRTQPHSTSERYLMSGIARCGECSFPMTANWYAKGTSSYDKYGYRYACLSNHGGCGKVTRVGPPIEALVEEVFLEEVRRSLGLVTQLPEVDETQFDQRLAEIVAEMADVNERRKAKRISTTTALDLIEELEAEQQELQRSRRQLVVSKVQRRSASPTLLDEWEGYTIGEKKTRMREYIKAVLVHPAGRGKRFDPALIEIVWHADS